MLIEQAAYSNRWRRVTPVAKSCFALAGMIAALIAATPAVAATLAALLAGTTCLGAGVSWGLYLRVAAPAVGFLALSCATLLFSLGAANGGLFWQIAPDALPGIAAVAARSLASLAALLGLVLTTPLPDLIGLLRRLRLPEVLIDLMVLCYRMLFVFSEVLNDTLTAQKARLGYTTGRQSLRSLGLLTANLTMQVWRRAHGLYLAAMARNCEGPLHFLAPEFVHAGRDTALAALAGSLLILLAASSAG